MMRWALSIDPAPFAPRISWRELLLAFLFAGLSLFLTTRAIDFPSTFHPDEPSKARQLLRGEYNFHHPMLMLSAARIWMGIAGTPAEQEAVTVAGRWTSAVFAGGAIFFLVLLAALLGGPVAAFAAGAFLVANHQLFELAHYFKEDPSLLFGLSAFFLAMVCYDLAPGRWLALALGAALGLAISGKYIGIVLLPLAAWVLWRHRRRVGFGMASALALGGALAVFAIVNIPVLFHPDGFAAGLNREMGYVIAGHKGITRSVPHGVYGNVFRTSTNPAIWVLLIFYVLTLILRWKSVKWREWIVAAFPLAFGILLSFSPKTHHRYFLPATAILLMLSGLAIAALFRLRWARKTPRALPWIAGAVFLLAFAAEMPSFLEYFNGFSKSGRLALVEYVRKHIPEGSVIVQDKRVDLDAFHLPYQFRGKLFAADEGTIDELRAQGIEYIAVADGDYGRYTSSRNTPTDEGAAEFKRRRAFYLRLFTEGQLLFECPPGRLQYLQPHLLLYRLPPADESRGN